MNVLQRKNGFLHWNLLGTESSYPVNVVRTDGTWTLYVFLSSYTCEEEIAVRKGLFNRPGDEIYHDFVDKHFIKFQGVEPDDPKTHKMYLEDMVNIKRFIYEECVQGVTSGVDSSDSDVLADDIVVVPTVQSMYDPSDGSEVKFKSLHHLRVSDSFYAAYDRSIENRSSEELLEIEVNFDNIDEIYNSSVKRVEGFLIGEDECLDFNRKLWVDKIPFEHKFAAVDEVFRPSVVQ